MDITEMLVTLKGQFTPVNVILFVLLIASEVIGTNENIKNSSIYGVIKKVLATLKDEVWPKTQQVPPTPVASTPAQTTASEPTVPPQQ